MEYDVFISHAHEDKDTVARPLTARLRELGVKVWLDEFELKLGDSIRRNIERGLSQSKFGIVILSKNFFRKEWTKRELDVLILKEETAQKVILPIWHNITKEEVSKFSLLLADKLAISTEKGIEYIAQKILSEVRDEIPLEAAAARIAVDGNTPVRDVIKPDFSKNADLIRKYGIIYGLIFLAFILFLSIISPTAAPDILNLNHINNPPEVRLENCQIDKPDILKPFASTISCRAYNGFPDKKITSIEVEIRLSTPDGHKILQFWLHRDAREGEPLKSTTYSISSPYDANKLSFNSRNIKVSVEKLNADN
ncbi:MAG TPA: toll/interleukin-1 receptor domain-containing protein [Pyrinomonadaceae bacterium]